MLCGTNIINVGPPYDIVQCLIAIVSVFQKESGKHNIFLCGIPYRNESFSVNRLIINAVNYLLQSRWSVKTFYFINQNNGQTLNNGALDFSSFYSGLFKIINLFFHLSYLFLLHPSRQLAAYCIKLLLLLYLMLILFRIPAANFLSHIPNIFYTDVSI